MDLLESWTHDAQQALRRVRTALTLGGDSFLLFILASEFASTRTALLDRLRREPGWTAVLIDDERLRQQPLAAAIVAAHEDAVRQGQRPLVIVTGLVDQPRDDAEMALALLNQARNEVIHRTRGPVVFLLDGKAQIEGFVRAAGDTWSMRTHVAWLRKVDGPLD